MSGTHESIDRGLARTAEPLKTVVQRLFKICNDGFFLVQVCEWKISYIADALLHAIESQNPVSLANNSRALIEHIAALTFVAETLDKLGASLEGQGSEAKINEMLSKSERIQKRCYYGKSPKTSDKNDAAPHIEGECLAAFEKFHPRIRDVYGFLCEYVHPNFGSNLLGGGGFLVTFHEAFASAYFAGFHADCGLIIITVGCD